MAARALGGDYDVLFNGVEVDRSPRPTPCADRAARPIFFVGRHEPRKGLAVLLEAMRDLPADVRLWIAGDGPETERLRARARRRRPHRVARPHQRRREGVAPARRPTCSARRRCGASRSASCCSRPWPPSTPVVASDLPGYPNVARAGRDALLVPPGDARGPGRRAAPGARRPGAAPPSCRRRARQRAEAVLDGAPGRALPRRSTQQVAEPAAPPCAHEAGSYR